MENDTEKTMIRVGFTPEARARVIEFHKQKMSYEALDEKACVDVTFFQLSQDSERMSYELRGYETQSKHTEVLYFEPKDFIYEEMV